MIRKTSNLWVWALFFVLVLPGALWAQGKVQKPPISQNQVILMLPHITSVGHEHYGYNTGEFFVKGTHFGATQGTKNVSVDGTIAALIGGTHWSDTYVAIMLPVAYIPWEHVYQFRIVDGGKVISNVYSQRFLYHFEKLVPDKGPVGTEVKLTPVFNLPASSGGLVVKIGTYTMTITSWKGGGYGEIKAKVPPGVPVGEHDVYLQKGSDVVSNKLKFKVQYAPILLP